MIAIFVGHAHVLPVLLSHASFFLFTLFTTVTFCFTVRPTTIWNTVQGFVWNGDNLLTSPKTKHLKNIQIKAMRGAPLEPVLPHYLSQKFVKGRYSSLSVKSTTHFSMYVWHARV